MLANPMDGVTDSIFGSLPSTSISKPTVFDASVRSFPVESNSMCARIPITTVSAGNIIARLIIWDKVQSDGPREKL